MSDEKKLALSPNEQVVAPEMSEEEKQAKADAEAYMREKHGGAPAEGGSIYDKVVKNTEDNAETDEPSVGGYSPQVIGGVAGGVAAHTNAVPRILNKVLGPAEGVYKPVDVKPKLPTAPSVQIEPHGPLIPNEVSGIHPEAYDTEVERVMQSMSKDEGNFGTGRQREDAQHWKSNRQSLATKSNLAKNPSAAQAIIDAPEMYPTRKGIAVPEHVAHEMAQEELRKKAQAKIAEDTAKAEASAKAAREAEATRIATQKAEEEAARRGKYLGVAKGVGKVGLGVLGGAMAGKDIYDLSQKPTSEWTDEDYGKAISSAGGLAMTVPTPFTEIGGLALTGAGMAYPYVAPYARKLFGGRK
jgi:hypothetical protein